MRARQVGADRAGCGLVAIRSAACLRPPRPRPAVPGPAVCRGIDIASEAPRSAHRGPGLAAASELTFFKAAAADFRTSLSLSCSKEIKAAAAALARGPMLPRPLAAISRISPL